MKEGIAIFVVIFAGCTPTIDTRHGEEELKISKCFNTGGIPIRSKWDGRLSNCIYPPK